MFYKKKSNFLKKALCSFLLLTILLTFTGCANYSAVALGDISSTQFQISNPALIASSDLSELSSPEVTRSATSSSKSGHLQMATKAFDYYDCKKYLDRDVQAKGYQPVQLFIENKSARSFYISPDRINLALAPADEVARSVHTSTAQRVGWYCVGGLFLSPLFVSAIVDGMKSSDANRALDADFQAKTLKAQTIQPHSTLSTIVFVPSERFSKTNDISVTFVDADSKKPLVLTNQLAY